MKKTYKEFGINEIFYEKDRFLKYLLRCFCWGYKKMLEIKEF